jgi:hypothetical protein
LSGCNFFALVAKSTAANYLTKADQFFARGITWAEMKRLDASQWPPECAIGLLAKRRIGYSAWAALPLR